MATIEERVGNILPMQFERINFADRVYFKDWLCDDFKNSRYPMPENIRKGRNNAIILAFIETFCCMACFGFYARRRSMIVLALILGTIFATAGGFYAKLKLSYNGLLAHAVYTISVIGGFYIYIIVDAIFITRNKYNKESTQMKEGNLNDTAIMLATSIPMILLFGMGIYSLILVLQIDSENDARVEQYNQRLNAAANQNQRRNDVQQSPAVQEIQMAEVPQNRESNQNEKDLSEQQLVLEILQIPDDARAGDMCCICMSAVKDSLFYPCGHQCLCFDCGQRFRREARHQVCPICRLRVKDVIKVYK